MKVPAPTRSFFFLLIFVVAASGQVSAPDSMPVIQGEIGYSMPQEAIDAEIAGSIRLGVRVEETGKVSKVWILSGPMWPCGKSPQKALDKLVDSLSDTIKTAKFKPGVKDGKAITQDIALSLKLENPNLAPPRVEADPVTGKVSPKMVTMGVLNGKALSLPKPAYPDQARASRAGGTVSVQILIDEEGKVKHAGAVSGHPDLQYAARDAACGAKFSPTTLQSHPLKVSGIITYNFVPGPFR